MVSYLFICEKAHFSEFRDIILIQNWGLFPLQIKQKQKILELAVHWKVASRKNIVHWKGATGKISCIENRLPGKVSNVGRFPVTTFQCPILFRVASFQCTIFFRVAIFQCKASTRIFSFWLIWKGKTPWIWMKITSLNSEK